MQCSAPTFDVNLNPYSFVIDLDSLMHTLVCGIGDTRGLRYALVTILGYIILAKLAGEDRLVVIDNQNH